MALNNLGTLNNLPKNESIFEVLIRVNGGTDSFVYLDEITIEFIEV